MSIFTRTSIYADVVGSETVLFEIPEWKPRVWIEMKIRNVPYPEQRQLHPGFVCKVDVYLNAETPDDLRIHNWGLD